MSLGLRRKWKPSFSFDNIVEFISVSLELKQMPHVINVNAMVITSIIHIRGSYMIILITFTTFIAC